MAKQAEFAKTTVYYDGLCAVCSSEINHYRRLPGSETLDFVDICHSEFTPEAHGLDPVLVHKVMHVKDAKGKLHTGVDAFQHIWRQIPRYHFMNRVAEGRMGRSILELGYRAFVRIRPYLPRKNKDDCSNSPYCGV